MSEESKQSNLENIQYLLKKNISKDFIEGLKTKKGNTQNAERIYIAAPGGLNVSRSLKVTNNVAETGTGHIFGAMTDWAGSGPKGFEKSHSGLACRKVYL